MKTPIIEINNEIKLHDYQKLELFILNICFELWNSLVDNSLIEESNQYIRLIRK